MNQRERLARLLDLAPPPDNPVNSIPGKNDWETVERTIGTKLPADYKAIIDRYGSGDFCDLLHILNPFCSTESGNLLFQAGPERDLYGPLIETYNEGRFGAFPENCPFSVYPDPGGLLPLAVNSIGQDYFWLTNGEPDAWTMIKYDPRGGWCYEQYASPLIEYLIEWLSSEVAKLAGRPSPILVARLNPVFCPLGQVRDYGKPARLS
jgi:hypothetical protein